MGKASQLPPVNATAWVKIHLKGQPFEAEKISQTIFLSRKAFKWKTLFNFWKHDSANLTKGIKEKFHFNGEKLIEKSLSLLGEDN